MSLLSSIGGFFAHKAQKKQAKKAIAGYRTAEDLSVGDSGAALTGGVNAFSPFLTGGQEAFTDQANMLKPGYDFTTSDPSYQWRVSQGVNALDRSASARGGIHSGGALKALTQFGQGEGSQEFQNEFARRGQLAGIGLQAAGGTAGAYTDWARRNQLARFNGAEGRATGYTAKGNAMAGQWGDAASGAEGLAAFFIPGSGATGSYSKLFTGA